MSDVRLPTADTKRRSKVPIPEQVDVAIVGAGLGGLGAAANLAQRGHSVALFDSHYLAGGCATMFARGSKAERFVFDVGFHYVGDAGPGGSFERQLKPLGIDLEFLPMDPDGFDVLLYPGIEFRTPVGLDNYRARLVEHFPEERRAIDKYLRLLTQVDQLITRMSKAGFKMSVGLVMQILRHAPIAALHANATIGSYLNRITKNPLLKAVMLGPHGDYALGPKRASLMLHCALMLHYLKGAYYLKGGGQEISDQLANKVEEFGGTVHLQCPVEAILTEDGRAVGVRAEPRGGEPVEVRARAVISGADIGKTFGELVPAEDVPAAYRQKVANFEWPPGLFVTTLAAKDDISARGFGRCNYWQSDTTDLDALYGDLGKGGRPNVQAAYITSATRKDPVSGHHAPAGVETLEVMTMVPSEPEIWGVSPEELQEEGYRKKPEYLERKQRVEDDLVHRLETLFPGVGQHIVFRESSTPLSHNRYTRSTAGGGYGIACTPEQFGVNRPGPRSEVPGLYLAGASTISGHGILGSLSSGKVAAKVVGKDLDDE